MPQMRHKSVWLSGAGTAKDLRRLKMIGYPRWRPGLAVLGTPLATGPVTTAGLCYARCALGG
jgi:hypothetical protein